VETKKVEQGKSATTGVQRKHQIISQNKEECKKHETEAGKLLTFITQSHWLFHKQLNFYNKKQDWLVSNILLDIGTLLGGEIQRHKQNII
jgi:hypothetical protein